MLDALWYLTPVGLEAPFYPVLHFAALGLIILYRNKVYEYIHSSSRNKIVLGTAICSYVAVMSDHMFGNLVWISMIGYIIPLKAVRDAIKVLGMAWLTLGISLPTGSIGDIFMLALPISTIERLTITAMATVVGVSLIRVIGWGRLLTSTKKPTKHNTKS